MNDQRKMKIRKKETKKEKTKELMNDQRKMKIRKKRKRKERMVEWPKKNENEIPPQKEKFLQRKKIKKT